MTPAPHSKTRAFSLVELLVATSILLVISAILMSATGWVANVWNHAENQTHLRQTDRLISERLENDLGQVVLPLHQGSTHLFFAYNPSDFPTTLKHPDALCFFAANSADRSGGDVAAIAYFLRPAANGTYTLCRATISPSEWSGSLDPADAGSWAAAAPADEASDYKGYLAGGVLGMWVRLYQIQPPVGSTPQTETAVSGSFDTRTTTARPSRIEVELLIANKSALARIDQVELPQIGAQTAESYYNALPESFRKHVGQIRISRSFPR